MTSILHNIRSPAHLRLLIAVALTFVGTSAVGQSKITLRLATGPSDSTYAIIGNSLRSTIESSSPDTQIELIPSSGSLSNLQMLQRREVDLVLSQNDVVREMSKRLQMANDQLPWRVVLVLAQEPVQVVAGPALREDNLSALNARPLGFGPADNDGHFTASNILKSLNISYSEVATQSAFDEAEQLRRSNAHAVFFVSNAPDPQVAALLADPAHRLLSFDTQEMGVLHDASPYYSTLTIPENTYPYQNRPTATIAVLTVLLCRADLSDQTVEQLTNALLRSAAYSTAQSSHFRLSLSDILQLTSSVGLPRHPGSERSLRSVPLTFRARAYLHWLQWGILVSLALLTLGIASLRRPRLFVIRHFAPRLPPPLARMLRAILFHRLLWQVIRTLAMFATLWLLGSAAMYLFERDVNVNFSNLKVSSLSILVYLFSGLEDRAPVTNGGWIGSVLMLISGLLIAAYITGQFASEITKHTLGVIQMTKNSAKNSILIVGWNPRAERIVRELFLAFEVDLPEYNVIILSDEKVDTQRYSEFVSRGVTFISGDAFDKKLLLRIGAHRAHSVIMMANDKLEDPDATTTLHVLALHSLCDGEGIPDEDRPRICAEVLNHRKIELIRDAGADEVVCHEDFGLGVLAQSAFAAKLTEVYQELLSYSVSSCEIYMMSSPNRHEEQDGEIPADIWSGLFEGKTFPQVSEIFNQNRSTENPPILIGIQRDKEVLLNPRTNFKLHDGDSLIVIAYERPRFDHLRPLISGLAP